ncbi:hypothetical protein KSP35_15445 [Aquihabitans sp. G128]|uniref:FtsX-like permease family protein n=1 Tax=Aquihabitans sp. G128 TaxID=2849779 RepID=UPI001C2317C5|nr:FtsX-like permease family protein [Aquihabitans sp. G128]QXC59766.1 hypothetical protein KSP35_15445 [Aquihabitans sp. G128]
MVVPRLAALFWQRGGARQRATLALTAAGVAASVVLALLALSVGPALSTRGDHVAWRTAVAVDADQATAVQRTTADRFGDRQITRVDLAPTGRGTPPVPPGLRAFPAPGVVWLSPALAALVAEQPHEVLADRYPGEVVGEIGPIGLAHPDDLVVVVGRPAGSLASSIDAQSRYAAPTSDGVAVPIAGFARHGLTSELELYRTLARMAAVLLVVPTFLLVGAAARLTAAQREQRLAVLRLAGATPGSVVGLTALEILGAALLGTVVGLVGYVAAVPVAAHVPLAGGAFAAEDLRLGAGWLLATLAFVPVAAAGSAVAALRKVVVGPLGVSRAVGRRRPSLLRFLVVPVAWVAFVSSARTMRDGGSTLGALAGLGAVIATLAVIGPWVAWALGATLARLARRPATLIAGRRIVADPRAAYRTVSGMVLAGLVAGFLFAVVPTLRAADLGDGGTAEVAVQLPQDQGAAVRAAVRAADPGSRLVLSDRSGGDPALAAGEVQGYVEASSPAQLDRARTAVLAAAPGALASSYDNGLTYALLLDDLGRASVVMALATLVMASAAIAISTSASILDQRTTLARLRLVGTPVSVLQRARRWQTLLPLVFASSGAMASGVVAGVVMLLAFAVAPERIAEPAVGQLVLLALAAVVAGALVVAATRPLLVATSRSSPRG